MEGLLSSSTPAGAASRTRVPSTMPSPLATDWGGPPPWLRCRLAGLCSLSADGQ